MLVMMMCASLFSCSSEESNPTKIVKDKLIGTWKIISCSSSYSKNFTYIMFLDNGQCYYSKEPSFDMEWVCNWAYSSESNSLRIYSNDGYYSYDLKFEFMENGDWIGTEQLSNGKTITYIYGKYVGEVNVYNKKDLILSQTFIDIPDDGGSVTFGFKASGNWKISNIPEWLTVSQTSGNGDAVVNLSFELAMESREANITIECNNNKQQLQVRQYVNMSSCANILYGAENEVYRVKGFCTKITDSTHGNWYMSDGTAEIFINGTIDANGISNNFSSLGIGVGDELIVRGTKNNNGSIVQIVDVSVLQINKSLIKVESIYVGDIESNILQEEGGEIVANISCKGNGVTVDIPQNAREWLSIETIKDGGTQVVFKATENTGDERRTTITLRTTDGKKDYFTSFEIIQKKREIFPVTCAEFNAASVGNRKYLITGLVYKVANSQYGNLYIQDYSGNIYVYGTTNYSEYPVKVGDVVNIIGPHAEYKGCPQMLNATIDKIYVSAMPISLAAFNESTDNDNKYYVLTGKITEISNERWGNIYIEDDNGTKVYLYGVYGDWTGVNKQYFLNDNDIKVGDEITVVTIKTSYKDVPQGKNAVCFGVNKN